MLSKEEFRAFGSSVPQPIQDTLQLSPVNFQAQMDGPFWFCESAGDVSRKLNAIIDLSVIDTSLNKMSKTVRSAQERSKLLAEQLEEAKREHAESQAHAPRISQFQKLRKLNSQLKQSKGDLEVLGSLVSEMELQTETARTWKEAADDEEHVITLLKEALQAREQFASMMSLCSEIKTAKAESVPPPNFGAVEEQWKELRSVRSEAKALQEFIKDLEAAENLASYWGSQHATNKKNFEQRIKDKQCPICQTPLKTALKHC